MGQSPIQQSQTKTHKHKRAETYMAEAQIQRTSAQWPNPQPTKRFRLVHRQRETGDEARGRIFNVVAARVAPSRSVLHRTGESPERVIDISVRRSSLTYKASVITQHHFIALISCRRSKPLSSDLDRREKLPRNPN